MVCPLEAVTMRSQIRCVRGLLLPTIIHEGHTDEPELN
jgi:hypothetical protein